ncbi:MAG: dihydropteroate synthase [Minwuia sp.]|nr:dihydropteroate synthase [Minwuia sp.]
MDTTDGIGTWRRVGDPRDLYATAGSEGMVTFHALPVRDVTGELLAIDVVARGAETRRWRTGADGAMALAASLPDAPGRALSASLRGIRMASERQRNRAATAVMGIVNVTPDSFSDGGVAAEHATAIARGRQLAGEGAAIIDVGGESTRPGAEPVAAGEEWRRVAPVLEALLADGHCISIDTRKAAIMAKAGALGVPIINDVSALTHDPAALAAVAPLDARVVLMHAQGDPTTMQQNPTYDDVVLDVFSQLQARISACVTAGIAPDRLIADPGIGFGKTFPQNLALLRHLPLFEGLGVPLLVGASRKGFVGWLTGVKQAGDRLGGSLGAALFAAAQGADVLRVHDVRETVEALTVFGAAGHGVAVSDALRHGQVPERSA